MNSEEENFSSDLSSSQPGSDEGGVETKTIEHISLNQNGLMKKLQRVTMAPQNKAMQTETNSYTLKTNRDVKVLIGMYLIYSLHGGYGFSYSGFD